MYWTCFAAAHESWSLASFLICTFIDIMLIVQEYLYCKEQCCQPLLSSTESQLAIQQHVTGLAVLQLTAADSWDFLVYCRTGFCSIHCSGSLRMSQTERLVEVGLLRLKSSSLLDSRDDIYYMKSVLFFVRLDTLSQVGLRLTVQLMITLNS